MFELCGENDISSYEFAILTRVSSIVILLIPTKSFLLSLIFICIKRIALWFSDTAIKKIKEKKDYADKTQHI